jgi:hypothetical protein
LSQSEFPQNEEVIRDWEAGSQQATCNMQPVWNLGFGQVCPSAPRKFRFLVANEKCVHSPAYGVDYLFLDLFHFQTVMAAFYSDKEIPIYILSSGHSPILCLKKVLLRCSLAGRENHT